MIGRLGIALIVALVAVAVLAIGPLRGSGPATSSTSCLSSADPLVRAAATGDTSAISSLIAEHHQVNAVDPGGRRALYCAVSHDDRKAARALLDAGADPNLLSTDDSAGQRPDLPLTDAVMQKRMELVALLLAQGADANAEASDQTPLGIATDSWHNDLNAVQVLLDRGADPNIADRSGFPLVRAAANAPDARVPTLLVEHGASVTARGGGFCLDLGDLEGLPSKASPEGCDTAIAAAAQAGHLDTVAMLLDHGADPTSAVYAASVGNHAEIARVLLDRGANPNGSGGTTPLLYNALFGNQDLVVTLLVQGADPNRGGAASARTLQLGASSGLITGIAPDQQKTLARVVCQLRGTAPNLPPIVAAAAMGHPDAVRALLDHGADPNANAAFDPQITALSAATAAHHDEVMALLTARGATPTAPPQTTEPTGSAIPPCNQ